MNNQRKMFEERLNALKLSESEKNCYRRLNFELLCSRAARNYEELSRLAQRIKPVIKINITEKKVVFCGLGSEIRKAQIVDAALNDNYLSSLLKAKVKIKPIPYELKELVKFTCYFPSEDENVANLTIAAVLQQAPNGTALSRAEYFEACFLSDNMADSYDRILQSHKAHVILYAPVLPKNNLLAKAERELSSSEGEDKAESEKETKEKRPCRIIPFRRRIQ
ncbi:MAG: hypothetical protein IJ677_02915 [Alphaproteobacteria bacterium]|nr:hypothetical protein [Alphaproteobacteria bacterium]